jgi:hypothetical protein
MIGITGQIDILDPIPHDAAIFSEPAPVPARNCLSFAGNLD